MANTLSNDSTSSSAIAEIGTSVSSTYFSAYLSGTLNNYTVLATGNSANTPSSGYYTFSAGELSLTIAKNSSYSYLKLYTARIYLGSTLVRTITFDGTYGYARLASDTVTSITFPLDETTLLYYKSGYNYANSSVSAVSAVTLSSSGTKYIYVELDYVSPSSTSTATTRLQLGTVYIYPLVLNSITLNTDSCTKKFYKNATFSSSGKVVNAIYYYNSVVGGNWACYYDVSSSASVTAPDMTTAGSQTVTVSYGSKSATYDVEIVGVASVSEDSASKYRYAIDTAPDTPTYVTITYTDQTTNTVAASDTTLAFTWTSTDFSAPGDIACVYTIYDSNTNETIATSVTKYLRDVSAIDITTEPTTTTYETNDTFSIAGMVVKATYDDAGTFSIGDETTPIALSDLTISEVDMTTVGTKEVTVTYREQTDTFSVTVNGLTNVRLDVPDALGKHLKGDTDTSLVSGLKVYATVSSEEDEIEVYETAVTGYTVAVDTDDVDISTTGTYTISVSVTYAGNTITESFDVEVYALESLSVSDYKDTFIYVDSAPTFGVGGLVVTATLSDGTEKTLSSSEYTYTAPDSMTIGEHEVTISATIGDTVSTTYTIYVIADYPTEIVSVDLSSWTSTFVAGRTFSKSGITVYAKMRGGANKQSVDFTTSLDGEVFGTDITDVYSTFSIYVTGYDEENQQDTTITVAYDSDLIEDDATLTAIYDRLESITVTPDSSITSFKAGETFTYLSNDTDMLNCVGTYAITGTSSISGADVTFSKTVGSTWSASEYGSNTITVTYEGQTATYSVTVKKLTSISVSTTQSQYNRYESLDTSTITLTKTYTDGTDTSTESLEYSSCTVTGKTTKMTANNDDDLTTTITFSYTEASVVATTTLTLTIKELSSVSLSVDSVSVNYGETMSLVGETLYATFNTGDIESLVIGTGNVVTIDDEDYSLAISPSDATTYIKNEVDDVTVGLTFGQATKYASFTIHCVYISSITIDASYYTEQTLYAGETVDLSNISVVANYVSTDSDDSDYPTTDDVTDVVTYDVADGFTLVAGSNSITATYSTGTGNTLQTKTATTTLTAVAVALESISVDTTDLTKALSDYVEGQSLNLSGLVINTVFNQTSSNGTVALASDDVSLYIDDVLQSTKTPSLTTDNNGQVVKVTYTYAGTTEEATVGTLTVVARAISSISVNTSSSTHDTEYYIGDTFSTSGLVIDVVYNDGYEATITSGFSTDFDSVTFTSSEVGTQTVTVTFSDSTLSSSATCTYDISVSVPALASLRFNTSAISLTVTNGNAYSVDELVVYGVFENDYEEQLTLDADSTYEAGEWYVSTDLARDSSDNVYYDPGDEYENLGTKTMVITGINPYDSTDTITGNLSITVEPNLELQEIQLRFFDADDEADTGEYAKSYIVGDTFDAKGVKVYALFKDSSWLNVDGWTTSNPTLGTTLRSGGRFTVTVSYTSQGVVKTQDYPIVVSMAYDSNLIDETTYQVAFNVTSVTHEEVEIEFDEDTQLPLFPDSVVQVDSTTGLNYYTGSDANSDCIGYVKLGTTSEVDGSVIENGQVILFDDPVNPIDGQGNIIVRFPHYVEGYSDRINNCHFAKMYNKRLFVSGNPDYPNFDWHSTEVNSAQVENYDTEEAKDLTYFSDLDYCKYGSENSAVVGYDVYRDGTLLVFKEKSQHEATIYTRTTQLVNASSYDGTVVSESELAEESYPCFEVNPNGGAGALSPYSIINFVGETLVLTRDGLKAITSKEVTYNNAKYSYDVSSHINNHLTKYNDLSDAIISQFEEKLLLKTDEGLYVGEYKLRDENSEYEWYFCDNIDAYYFFELDDQLYFSDDEGNVCRFFDDGTINVIDKPRVYIGTGGATISIDAANDTLIVTNTDYSDDVVEGREFHLLNEISEITGTVDDLSQVHATMGHYGFFINSTVRDTYLEEGTSSFDQTAYVGLIDTDNNELIVKSYDSDGEMDYEQTLSDHNFFYDGRIVYVDQIVGSVTSLDIDVPYTLSRVDSDTSFDYRYQLLDSDGEVVELLGIETMRLSFRVNDLALAYITDVEDYGDDGAKTFKVSIPFATDDDDELVYTNLDLIYYNDRNGTYSGVITDHVDIESVFESKALNLGHDLYQKSIYSWSIINDTSIASKMEVGYIASRKYAGYKNAVQEIGGARQLNFDGFQFSKLHFTNDELPHIYTRTKLVPRVGFIKFIFRNTEGTRMVLSKLEIIYSYSLLTKGVK